MLLDPRPLDDGALLEAYSRAVILVVVPVGRIEPLAEGRDGLGGVGSGV
jgi:hypothetical protein